MDGSFGVDYDVAKGLAVAWLVVIGVGLLLVLGTASKRGGGATALGFIGLLLALPQRVVDTLLIFDAIDDANTYQTLVDSATLVAVLQVIGWAFVILALVVAKTPAARVSQAWNRQEFPPPPYGYR